MDKCIVNKGQNNRNIRIPLALHGVPSPRSLRIKELSLFKTKTKISEGLDDEHACSVNTQREKETEREREEEEGDQISPQKTSTVGLEQ